MIETPTAGAPSALSATPGGGGSSISLSWTAASGATNYRVERKGAGGSFALAGTSSSTSFTDNGVTTGSAYLYKVCAADGQNNCTSNYTNVALGATVTFPTDPTITSIVDDPTGVNVTKVKSAHITELRSAVDAVRSLAGWGAATWTYPAAVGDTIHKEDVRDLREKLDEALVALAVQTSTYTDSPLAGAPNGTLIKKTHITELRDRTKSGSGMAGSGGSSGGVRYVLSDVQGSSRAVMNNGTYGSSAIVARHDYLPFGQEIGSGTGLRSGTQGYGASDTNRQKYGLTERDDTTGLDHTWWRKYESFAGRMTTPDPYTGSMSMGDPQSFNRYTYVRNDPTNFVDPSGLLSEQLDPPPPEPNPGGGFMSAGIHTLSGWSQTGDRINGVQTWYAARFYSFTYFVGGVGFGSAGRGSTSVGGGGPMNPREPQVIFDAAYNDCARKLGNAPAPGLVPAASIVQISQTTGVDPTLFSLTWHEESRFRYFPENYSHGDGSADIGPGQLHAGTWDKAPYTSGLRNPFGTNRAVGQVFNGNPIENLLLMSYALDSRSGGRAKKAGLYKAGSTSGPGYQGRVDRFNKYAQGYDAFFNCLARRGFKAP